MFEWPVADSLLLVLLSKSLRGRVTSFLVPKGEQKLLVYWSKTPCCVRGKSHKSPTIHLSPNPIPHATNCWIGQRRGWREGEEDGHAITNRSQSQSTLPHILSIIPFIKLFQVPPAITCFWNSLYRFHPELVYAITKFLAFLTQNLRVLRKKEWTLKGDVKWIDDL